MFKIDHIGIVVEDIEKSISFYESKLGLKLSEKYKDNNVQVAFIRVGQSELELIQFNNSSGVPKPGIWHIAFGTNDLADSLKKLSNLGIKPDDPIIKRSFERAQFVFIGGPNGEDLELCERL